MNRFLAKSLILFLLLVSLSGATFLSPKQDVGSRPETVAGAVGPKPSPARYEQSVPASSDLRQYTASGHVLGFAEDGVVIASASHALRVEYVNARLVSPVEEGTSSGPAKGQGRAPELGKVTYPGLWDGVSVVYEKTASGVVKSTYYIQPGESKAPNLIEQIRLRYNVPIKVDRSRNLVVTFATGEMKETRPVAWQEISGKKVAVNAEYCLLGEQEVGFKVGANDSRYPLVIDPTLSWNTFLGGSNWDDGKGIAVDTNGNVYVAGSSQASWGALPVRPYSYGLDCFVAKLDATGALQWNTFLGGGSGEQGNGIAIDTSGNVYVTGGSGYTWGDSQPINPFAGSYDAFVAKLNTNGVLQWYTFLGGLAWDQGQGIAVDTSGNSYVTGYSAASWGSPLLPFAGGSYDAFVAKLDASGVLQWNTFLGGADVDQGNGIAVDTSGNSYATGYSAASWGSPLLPFAGGSNDAFVAKLDANGALQWNAFLGGGDEDQGTGIAVDASGNPYVTGYSRKAWGQQPVRPFAGGQDAFVAKLDANGALQWNTFLGGSSGDYGFGIAVDTSGRSYVTGRTFYATWGSPVRAFTAGYDAFAAKLDANGALQWNTFLGGSGDDEGYGIAVDVNRNAYVTGYSDATWGSPLLPITGGTDAFVAKIGNGIRADFNKDGQEDILWRSYGNDAYQGWNLVWFMEQSGTLSSAALGISQSQIVGSPVLNAPIPSRSYFSPVDVGNSRVLVPAASSETPLGLGYRQALRPKMAMRHPMDTGHNLAPRGKGRAVESGLERLPIPKAAALTSSESAGSVKIASLDQSGQAVLSTIQDTSWEIAGAGDFDGNGTTDILWRYYGAGPYQGWNVIWFMDGTTVTGQGLPNVVYDTNWRIERTGDFDGDGKTDILWRYYGTGTYQGWNVIWYMNGATIKSQGVPNAVLDTNWKADGVGDFDGNGTTDILWRYYGTGAYQGWNVIWFMNGTTITSQGLPNVIPDTNWKVDGVGDFDGDGKSDILWRYYGAGTYQGWNILWYMNGASIKSQEALKAVSDTNWRIANR